MARFVLEIGTEELPARFLANEEKAVLELSEAAFADAGLPHGQMTAMATPRRLALIVENMPERQPEKEEIVTGPPVAYAYKEGVPTRALIGFATGNGITPNDVFTHKTEKGEYVACRKKTGGNPTIEAMAAIIPQIIEKLPFAKSMRWGTNQITYARPLRWILALFGDAVVPFRLGPLESGNETFGHRVHGIGPFTVSRAEDYENVVASQCAVTLSPEARREEIVNKGNALAENAGCQILWQDKLLDEVCGLVEHPLPLLGDFDPSFLEIPDQVLLTSMESHQKSFGVTDKDEKLQPHFLTVLNFEPKDYDLVKRGWERVLRARLEDARFFWKADTQDTFENWLEKLNHVIFIGPLGSIGDKARRLEALCQWLANKLAPAEITPEQAARAGLLAKADLVSAMVGEFDTLQGIMGGIYAAKAGESEAVARAIGEQYLPAGPDTPLPATPGGCILSIADKADTLAGSFGLNMIPTGAADPNGLRRCALGIIRILIDRNWQINVSEIFAKARELYGEQRWKLDAKTSLGKLDEFFKARLRNYFLTIGYETVFVDAVLAAGANNPADAKARLDALVAFGKTANFSAAGQTLKRVENMAKKAANPTAAAWQNDLLKEAADQALASYLAEYLPSLDKMLQNGSYAEALASIENLRQPVDSFFDNVLVLCDDQALRANRLSMLNAISSRFARIAQFASLQL